LQACDLHDNTEPYIVVMRTAGAEQLWRNCRLSGTKPWLIDATRMGCSFLPRHCDAVAESARSIDHHAS
jgi:hypothetical protein